MKIVSGICIAIAMLAASASPAQAQPKRPPIDCGMFFQIKGGSLQPPVPTPVTRITCNFDGNFVPLIQNLDDEHYTLTFENFRFNPSSASLCKDTHPQSEHPGKAKGKKMIFQIKPFEVGATDLRKLKVKGANNSECYKFTIRIEDPNGNGTTIDPELEVTDPPPPPPLKPPFN